MAGSVNKVFLLGNVGRDPEIKSTQGGTRLANLSIATSESWKDKSSGERKERVEWHRVVVWPDSLVTIIEKYVRKGDRIYIEGALQTRKWTDNAGVEKFSTEIVVQGFHGGITLLGDRGKSGGGSARSDDRDHDDNGRSTGRGSARSRYSDLDDEIPF